MALDAHLELARQQIEFARQYLLQLIEDLEEDEWFRFPAGAATHIAWHVGHVAMAEYGLTLFRQRGRQPQDAELMSGQFRKAFSKGSIPVADPAKYPSAQEIRAVLDRVHRQALTEMETYTSQQLAEPVDPPYAVFATRLGAILFCPAHEMLHAGQIGLLRRLLGKQPLR